MSQSGAPLRPADATRWPGGWYVYEDGQVNGPLAADEAFTLSPETHSGKPRLVSRKGFTQWYALQDLSEIFRLTAQMGETSAAQAALTAQQMGQLAQVHTAQVNTAQVNTAQVNTAQVNTAQVNTAQPAPWLQVVGKTLAPKSTTAQHSEADIAKPAKITPVPDLAHERKTREHLKPRTPVPAAKPIRTTAKVREQALLQQYLQVQKRLRLGKLRDPWLGSFFGFAVTLGLYWLFWFKDLAKEAAWHVRLPSKEKPPRAIFAAIPGVHCYMTYRLAKLVATMEAQNRYAGVKPSVAAALAIVPPLAMLYLQRAANRHWLLHVQHAMQAQQAH